MAGRDARVLILGSFPSVISLERQEYYANPRNQFWQIMGQLFEFEASLPYSLRCKCLRKGGVALWDVCKSVDRPGSLDARIDPKAVVPNDLGSFLKDHPRIQLVAVNGQKAAAILDRLPLNHPALLSRLLLPSTSPAHAALPIGEKVLAWSVVRDGQHSLSNQNPRGERSPRRARRSARKTGLALAGVEGLHLVIRTALCASKQASAAAIVAQWIGSEPRALVALDAPLGWPEPLSRELSAHSAGQPIGSSANALFRRQTDDEICHRLGKRSLDVGASWIARTACSALEFLQELQRALNRPVTLVWTPAWPEGVRAIEVYPAATRLSLGAVDRGGSFQGLTRRLRFPPGGPPRSQDARDAVVCALGAAEFLLGRAIGPTAEQEAHAHKEGWIWAGPPQKSRRGGRSRGRPRRG
jgi:double-stranded uracil-DNA glycosylase